MAYFEKLIENINNDTTLENLYDKIVNPFSPYFLCNHFIGDECHMYNIKIPANINDILITDNLSIIENYDIIYVEVHLFNIFIEYYLPQINKKIILITGQYLNPQIELSNKTDELLNHPNIIYWISQNPIYSNNPKYIAFPYGIQHSSLKNYAKALLNNRNTNKDNNILYLPIDNNTNICRKKLPVLNRIESSDMYNKIASSKFVISPIGDRDDCYRHYEAIGLGTIPISNVKTHYNAIFGNNMYYCVIDKIVNILNTNSIDYKYHDVNKDLICFDYHKDIIFNKIKFLKQKNLNSKYIYIGSSKNNLKIIPLKDIDTKLNYIIRLVKNPWRDNFSLEIKDNNLFVKRLDSSGGWDYKHFVIITLDE
jgi:hypothetical protein